MKVCSKCKCEKHESEFYKNSQMNDGLDYYCKECRKRKTKSNRCYNKVHHNKSDYDDTRKFIESLKSSCYKCGEYRHWVLQFHHIDPSTKRFMIGSPGTRSQSSILQEVQKCVCLCANCHNEFHYFYGANPENPVEDLEEYLDLD